MDKTLIQVYLKKPVYRYFSARTLEVNVLVLFTLLTFLLPLRKISAAYQYHVSYFVLPHLFTYLYFQLAFFGTVIYFFSDIPYMNVWEMNRIMRLGRIKWTAECVCSIILNSYLLMANVFVLSLVPLVGILEWKMEWGKLLYTLAAVGDDRLFFNISYKIISAYTPGRAMFLLFFLGGGIISLTGLVMFAISIWFNRIAAAVFVTVFTALPLIAENLAYLDNNLKVWYYSPVSWTRLDFIELEYVRGLPGLDYIVPALLILVMTSAILIFAKINRVDFQWNDEETI
mgnify:FL=1